MKSNVINSKPQEEVLSAAVLLETGKRQTFFFLVKLRQLVDNLIPHNLTLMSIQVILHFFFSFFFFSGPIFHEVGTNLLRKTIQCLNHHTITAREKSLEVVLRLHIKSIE